MSERLDTPGITTRDEATRRLLLFIAPADHPHRDLVSATLAWLAAAEGSLFECYYCAHPTGSHQFASGPFHGDGFDDMRGGTLVGAHHLEQLLLVVQRFDCEAACLGSSVFDAILDDSQVPRRSSSPDVWRFYDEVFAASSVPRPDTLLVVGDGRGRGRLRAFAFPEVVHRRLLAIADGDPVALERLRPGMQVETLWTTSTPSDGAVEIRSGNATSPAAETEWMAQRWAERVRGFLLGDGELAGRWIPTAARRQWTPIHGAPQLDVIERLSGPIARQDVVFGRQYDDRDFLALSRLGVAFQLVDPGRPPFPVLGEAPRSWPTRAPLQLHPDDACLVRWAREGRVLSTLLFWTGMARELECLYALTDAIDLAKLACGLVLTVESFRYMPHPPLSLTQFESYVGGLRETTELVLASAGAGAMIESAAPPGRFASVLARSVDELAAMLGGREHVPRGWWPTMDAPLLPHRTDRVAVSSRAPYLRIRYEPAPLGSVSTADPGRPTRRLRSAVAESPLRGLFEPLRPFTRYRPGPPNMTILSAVRDAGFEYAFTASGFAGPPRVVLDVPDLIVLTYTAGRWDGWTPFITVNDLSDLRAAERRLLRARRPGWLVGTVDASLWAFTGPVWDRGRDLFQLCSWLAKGGESGGLINTTPATVARYARVLADMGLVETLRSA